MEANLVHRTAAYVRRKLYNEPSGHDWFHIERVWQTAKLIQEKEGGDLLIIELAALLHNLKEHHYPLYYEQEEKGCLVLDGILDILQIEGEVRKKVIEATEDSKFRADDTRRPQTVEGKILQDANWLDSLGAIGIARVFAAGGYIERPLYDPKLKPRKGITNRQYRQKKETTSFNYLFEKSLRIVQFLNTETARHIARRRTVFIQEFVNHFLEEWKAEDFKKKSITEDA